MTEDYKKYSEEYETHVHNCAHHIKKILKEKNFFPQWGIVLGSGLNDLAALIEDATIIPYSEIPGVPKPTVEGHEGNMIVGTLEGVPLIALQGRKHYYEGADLPYNVGMLHAVFLVHVLADLDVKNFFVTNAAGGLNTEFKIGDLMIISSHVNKMGANPLIGRQKEFERVDGEAMRRFDPMNDAYDKKYTKTLCQVMKLQYGYFRKGIYLAVCGPNYESVGECLEFRKISDAVGMSTIPEVMAARSRGMRVVGFSCITNTIDDNGNNAANHEEVKAVLESKKVRDNITETVRKFFQNC